MGVGVCTSTAPRSPVTQPSTILLLTLLVIICIERWAFSWDLRVLFRVSLWVCKRQHNIRNSQPSAPPAPLPFTALHAQLGNRRVSAGPAALAGQQRPAAAL